MLYMMDPSHFVYEGFHSADATSVNFFYANVYDIGSAHMHCLVCLRFFDVFYLRDAGLATRAPPGALGTLCMTDYSHLVYGRLRCCLPECLPSNLTTTSSSS